MCISNLGDYYKVNDSLSNCGNSFSPIEFKNTLGFHNGQFITSNTNDSKELILYLLEALHKEMNYFGDRNIRLNCNTNQYDIVEAYNHFTTTNNSNNCQKYINYFMELILVLSFVLNAKKNYIILKNLNLCLSECIIIIISNLD